MEVEGECCSEIVCIAAWPAQPGGGSGRTQSARGQIWPFSFFSFLLSSDNGPARFVTGANTPKPGWPAQQNMQLQQPGTSKIWMACGRDIWFANMLRKFTS